MHLEAPFIEDDAHVLLIIYRCLVVALGGCEFFLRRLGPCLELLYRKTFNLLNRWEVLLQDVYHPFFANSKEQSLRLVLPKHSYWRQLISRAHYEHHLWILLIDINLVVVHDQRHFPPGIRYSFKHLFVCVLPMHLGITIDQQSRQAEKPLSELHLIMHDNWRVKGQLLKLFESLVGVGLHVSCLHN